MQNTNLAKLQTAATNADTLSGCERCVTKYYTDNTDTNYVNAQFQRWVYAKDNKLLISGLEMSENVFDEFEIITLCESMLFKNTKNELAFYVSKENLLQYANALLLAYNISAVFTDVTYDTTTDEALYTVERL